jgi:hypothetical protein
MHLAARALVPSLKTKRPATLIGRGSALQSVAFAPSERAVSPTAHPQLRDDITQAPDTAIDASLGSLDQGEDEDGSDVS